MSSSPQNTSKRESAWCAWRINFSINFKRRFDIYKSSICALTNSPSNICCCICRQCKVNWHCSNCGTILYICISVTTFVLGTAWNFNLSNKSTNIIICQRRRSFNFNFTIFQMDTFNSSIFSHITKKTSIFLSCWKFHIIDWMSLTIKSSLKNIHTATNWSPHMTIEIKVCFKMNNFAESSFTFESLSIVYEICKIRKTLGTANIIFCRIVIIKICACKIICICNSPTVPNTSVQTYCGSIFGLQIEIA